MIPRLLGTYRRCVPRVWRDRRIKRALVLVVVLYVVAVHVLSGTTFQQMNLCVQHEDRCCQTQSISRTRNSSMAPRLRFWRFSYRHNHKACSDSTDLVILVNSAAPNQERRIAMRGSWLSYAKSHYENVTVLFFMGGSEVPEEMKAVDKEDARFGDVIQANFKDTYENLTLKTIAMLQWVSEYCPQARQMMKVDDDVYIHFDHLMTLLQRVRQYPRHILGKIGLYEKPNRETERYKWAVSTEEYSGDTFPPFAHGPAYVISGDLVGDLWAEAASHQKPLKLEDVFVTGVAARAVGALHIGDCGFTIAHRMFFARRTSVSGHKYSPEAMRYMDWTMWLLNWTVPITDVVLWVFGS